MAITGHFIDDDWYYREILLGFESLHRTHYGINLLFFLIYFSSIKLQTECLRLLQIMLQTMSHLWKASRILSSLVN